jgi:hypothetical protein
MLENVRSNRSNLVHDAQRPLRDTAEATAGVSFQSEQAANRRVRPVLQQPPNTPHNANRLSSESKHNQIVNRKKGSIPSKIVRIPLLQHIEIVVPRIRQSSCLQVRKWKWAALLVRGTCVPSPADACNFRGPN